MAHAADASDRLYESHEVSLLSCGSDVRLTLPALHQARHDAPFCAGASVCHTWFVPGALG